MVTVTCEPRCSRCRGQIGLVEIENVPPSPRTTSLIAMCLSCGHEPASPPRPATPEDAARVEASKMAYRKHRHVVAAPKILLTEEARRAELARRRAARNVATL